MLTETEYKQYNQSELINDDFFEDGGWEIKYDRTTDINKRFLVYVTPQFGEVPILEGELSTLEDAIAFISFLQ